MQNIEDLPWVKHPQTPYMQQFLREIYHANNASIDENQNINLNALINILKHAKDNVSYYKQAFAHNDIQLHSATALENFPILTKDIIRNQSNNLIPENFKRPPMASKIYAFHTSGSTGTPMKVFRGERNILLTRAISLFYHLFHERDFSLSNASIITTKQEFAASKIWASCLQTGPGYVIDISQNTQKIFDRLLEIQPHYIQTHPSTLKRLVDISIEQKQFLDSLKEVRVFGELLEPNIVNYCNQHWNVKLSNNYSSEEMATMAISCPVHPEHLHIINNAVHIEVVDERGKSCTTGQLGRILVTQLRNLAMPLIRYEIGDMGVLGEHCDCGSSFPIIKRIEGRTRNLITLKNGDTFHPVFDEEKILAVAPIKRYQAIQKQTGDIHIHLMHEKLSEQQEQKLRDAFNFTFKNNFPISFIYENDIQFSSRNKFEIFKSELSS